MPQGAIERLIDAHAVALALGVAGGGTVAPEEAEELPWSLRLGLGEPLAELPLLPLAHPLAAPLSEAKLLASAEVELQWLAKPVTVPAPLPLPPAALAHPETDAVCRMLAVSLLHPLPLFASEDEAVVEAQWEALKGGDPVVEDETLRVANSEALPERHTDALAEKEGSAESIALLVPQPEASPLRESVGALLYPAVDESVGV